MNDLISRQDAIDALGERPIVWTDNDDYTLGERNQYDMDRLAIEAVPSADVQPAQQWIPCSEKLPDKDGLYLVTTSKEQVQMHVFNHNGNSEEYWMRCNKAWMPLPEPWKGGQDDQGISN